MDLTHYDYALLIRDPVVEIPGGVTLVPIRHGRTYALLRIDRTLAR